MFKKKDTEELIQEDILDLEPIVEKKPKKKKRKMKKLHKRLIAGGVVVVLLGLLIIPGIFAAEPLPQAETASAFVGDVQEVLDTSGYIKSNQEKTYFSPVNAVIQEVNAELGETVKKGEALVLFDLSELENQNKEAQLSSEASDYDYQDAINQGSDAASKYSSSSAKVSSLESAVASKENEVKGLQNKIAEASRNAENEASNKAAEIQGKIEDVSSKLSAKQAEALEIDSKISEIDIKLLVAGEDDDTSGLEADKKKLEAELAPINVEIGSLSSEIETLNQQMGSISVSTSDVTRYQSQLENASSDLAKLQSDLAEQKSIQASSEAGILSEEQEKKLEVNNNLQELSALSVEELIEKGKDGIKAEFDGVVADVAALPGASAMQGTQLVTIASNEDVSVEITVTKYEFEKLRVGQKAEISVAGYEYEGTVEKINKIATTNDQGNAVIGAKIKIDNADENIYLGVEAKVSVLLEKAENALLVPVEVVNVGKEGSFCYVVENNVIVKNLIETGVSSDEYVEIISGLDVNAQIVTTITTDIEEGVTVLPVAANTDENVQNAGTEVETAAETEE